MDTKERLKEAIDTGEILTIIYHGGSQPGTTRQISPMSFSRDRVRARCLISNKPKYFTLDKIDLVDDPAAEPTYEKDKKFAEPASIQIALEPYLETIRAMGWLVEINDQEAGLYRTRKNGNRLKYPDVALRYHATTRREDERGRIHEIPSTMPWHVNSNKAQNSFFKSLSHAAERFIKVADEVAQKVTF